MTSAEQDIRFLTEGLPQLQDYLLSNELYWPLSNSLPRLTPGSVLLTLERLDVTRPDEARKFRAELEPMRARWRVAWEKKAAREMVNRLRLWSQYLSDYQNDPVSAGSYPTEVRGRTILQLLLPEVPEAPEKAVLAELDAMLKARLVFGEFAWEADLQEVFPMTDFWFLYGKL
jgi:hypothetical protein